MVNDKLTNLLFYDDFKEEVGKVIANHNQRYMLLSGNVSNFKYINNMYGYEQGDHLLKAIADFFFTGFEDCVVACRMHSDRFLALINIANDSEEQIGNDLQKMFAQFCEVIEQEFPLVNLHFNCGGYIIQDGDTNVSEIVWFS